MSDEDDYIEVFRPGSVEDDYIRLAEARVAELEAALRVIRDFDSFMGGPIAPRENHVERAMREIARGVLSGEDTDD